jgi:hypothetical protein
MILKDINDMKLYIIILYWFLGLYSTSKCLGNGYSYFTLEVNNTCPLYYIKINNILIESGVKRIKIRINETYMDTLSFSDSKENKYSTFPTLAKFRNGEEYIIKCNYSNFDIYPVSGKINGEIRFFKKNIKDTLVVKAFESSIKDTLINDISTKYFKKHNKENFHNDVFFYRLSDLKTQTRRAQSLCKINLIFLHGEKYTLTYDHKSKTIAVNRSNYGK